MRMPNRSVELDDIISGQILGDDPEVIALVLKIHLALEALIIELIQTKESSDRTYKLSFPDKTKRAATAATDAARIRSHAIHTSGSCSA